MDRIVFLDRDGTIGGGRTVQYPNEFTLYPFTLDCIRLLKETGYYVFAFTNQPGISRGEVKAESFKQELVSFGFDATYLCPHTAEEGCSCRKPSTGLLERAAKEHQIDLKNSVVIGDRWSDMVAARQAGCLCILVQTGAGREAMRKYRHKWVHMQADYTAKNLKHAVNWLLDK
ncbi:HAD-IIIA family hydrolase [Shimazuella kribbensis]|uniref:HAD-IIIA family hydrolase n=1 Tax=Shimazuella kribbensis TaxID=139808 RepID=UPI000418A175|nr:HAD-IIIA family hydrolase [Shimazuella kribbensis]